MVSLKHAKNVLWSQVSKHGRLHVVFYRQRHLKYEQLKHCVGKTKTNRVVLQTLSTTFQFLRAFWILVIVVEYQDPLGPPKIPFSRQYLSNCRCLFLVA